MQELVAHDHRLGLEMFQQIEVDFRPWPDRPALGERALKPVCQVAGQDRLDIKVEVVERPTQTPVGAPVHDPKVHGGHQVVELKGVVGQHV
ncbi:hypothetical protein V7S57_00745 [Caulobacter sp. CCNWLY153]|uniref:hypothetical protein n=1 Tax=unclassified Caulobacter TaxID=2648921 RepID=UPI002FF28C6A